MGRQSLNVGADWRAVLKSLLPPFMLSARGEVSDSGFIDLLHCFLAGLGVRLALDTSRRRWEQLGSPGDAYHLRLEIQAPGAPSGWGAGYLLRCRIWSLKSSALLEWSLTPDPHIASRPLLLELQGRTRIEALSAAAPAAQISASATAVYDANLMDEGLGEGLRKNVVNYGEQAQSIVLLAMKAQLEAPPAARAAIRTRQYERVRDAVHAIRRSLNPTIT